MVLTIIWSFTSVFVNDYHLLLVPQMVRSKLPKAIIGFFLHIAFPSSEIFRCLALREELLQGMLGANLIGFQTYNVSLLLSWFAD